MSTSKKVTILVTILVGSLRQKSFNLRIAREIVKVAPPAMSFEWVALGDLPLYNEDLETAAPPIAWTRMRVQVRNSDAALFVTPEYNRSIPAALNNAVDVGSRPYGSAVWDKMPAGVFSVSVGAIGGFGAASHLRQSLVSVGMRAMAQPEVYIGSANSLFDADGNLANEATRQVLARIRKCIRRLDRCCQTLNASFAKTITGKAADDSPH
jgi:chromate reductase, NAD(P)H dehydrogenase (quinone)